MMRYGYWPMMSGWGGFSFLGVILTLAFWFLVIYGLVAILYHLFGHKAKRHYQDDEMEMDNDEPIQILKQRYAKGEITKKEYLEMKKDLAE